MIVAFLHARQSPRFAELMLQSVRRHMPGVECLQLTDMDTPAIPGCSVKRLEWDDAVMIWRMKHLSELDEEVLCLDTDVMVQADLSTVFKFPFDVALTWRDGPIYDGNGTDITKVMPVNCGVMFSRSQFFWRECIDLCKSYDFSGWVADQMAVPAVSKHFNTLRLHCDNFNYTPRHGEDVSKRLALHFKGQRKEMMLEYARNHGYKTEPL